MFFQNSGIYLGRNSLQAWLISRYSQSKALRGCKKILPYTGKKQIVTSPLANCLSWDVTTRPCPPCNSICPVAGPNGMNGGHDVLSSGRRGRQWWRGHSGGGWCCCTQLNWPCRQVRRVAGKMRWWRWQWPSRRGGLQEEGFSAQLLWGGQQQQLTTTGNNGAHPADFTGTMIAGLIMLRSANTNSMLCVATSHNIDCNVKVFCFAELDSMMDALYNKGKQGRHFHYVLKLDWFGNTYMRLGIPKAGNVQIVLTGVIPLIFTGRLLIWMCWDGPTLAPCCVWPQATTLIATSRLFPLQNWPAWWKHNTRASRTAISTCFLSETDHCIQPVLEIWPGIIIQKHEMHMEAEQAEFAAIVHAYCKYFTREL